MVITPTVVFSFDDPHRPKVKITRRRPIADDIERTEPWESAFPRSTECLHVGNGNRHPPQLRETNLKYIDIFLASGVSFNCGATSISTCSLRRRLLALAAICEGASRTDGAKIDGVTLQIFRDWVREFNAHGPDEPAARIREIAAQGSPRRGPALPHRLSRATTFSVPEAYPGGQSTMRLAPPSRSIEAAAPMAISRTWMTTERP